MSDQPRRGGSRLPVLLYHHVGPTRPGTLPSLSVDPRRFATQIEWLRSRRFRSISADEAAAWISDGTPLPPRAVVLTFDDGYRDLAEHAFPLLESVGFSALVFVVTGLVGSDGIWDREISGSAHPLLSANEIRSWRERGIEFGAHSRTHADLTGLADQEVRAEVTGSGADLAELLGRPVSAFAYPYGAVTEQVRRVAAETYRIAFGIEEGLNRPGSDPFRLRRTMVQPGDSRIDLASRVRFGRSLSRNARGRLLRLRPGWRGNGRPPDRAAGTA